MKIIESIRKRAFLLEFVVWVVVLLVAAIIFALVMVITKGEEATSDVASSVYLLTFFILGFAFVMSGLALIWRRDTIAKVSLLVSSFGTILLPLFLGDVIRILVVKRLYLGEKPLENALLGSSYSSASCGHCNGTGVCEQSTRFPGEQSCPSCLREAGVPPTSKRVVQCSVCGGTGKLVGTR